MTIDEIMKSITDCDMSYAMRRAADAAVVLHLYQEPLEKFLAACPDCSVQVDANGINLHGADRIELMRFLECFGGDWEKKVNDYYKNKMDYVQSFPHPLRDKSQDFEEQEDETTGEVTKVPYKYQRKLSLVVSAVAPPPSCKIVEEEVIVPERKEIRKRVVCTEETPVTPEQPATT